MRQAGVGRDFCGHLVQFTSAQGVQKAALEDDALALPPRQTFLNQMLGACLHGIAGLAAESAHSERHRITFDQAVVKPGRVMFELAGVPEPLAREAMRLAGHKLPVRTKFVLREEL